MIHINRPLVFLDFETTGTNTQTDRIVEMSFVKIMPDMERIIRTYRVNPGIPIPKGASDVHGICDLDVKDEQTFASLSKRLFDFIDGCDLAGYKSNTFDIPLLYSEFARAGIVWDYSKHNFVDVGNIFIIQEPRTLAAAMKFYCGKELEGAHGAEADILATVEVFQSQLEKYEDVLPGTIEELALFSNYGKKNLDMAGKFVWDKEGKEILFNFGKSKGLPAKSDYGFLRWMLGGDFAPDTKDLARKIMNEIQPS